MKIQNPPNYLSQRDNKNLDGTDNRVNQCMISTFTMFMNWCADRYKFEHFDELAYLATIEGWIKNTRETDSRFDWQVHVDVVNTILEGKKVKDRLEIEKTIPSKKEVIESLQNNIPVPMSINISAFYNGAHGHIVLCVGWNESGLFFHDPFGDAKSRYKKADGESVFYSQAELNEMLDNDRRCAILRLK